MKLPPEKTEPVQFFRSHAPQVVPDALTMRATKGTWIFGLGREAFPWTFVILLGNWWMIKEMPSSRIRDAWYLDAHTHTKTSFIKLAGTVVDDHNLNLLKKKYISQKKNWDFASVLFFRSSLRFVGHWFQVPWNLWKNDHSGDTKLGSLNWILQVSNTWRVSVRSKRGGCFVGNGWEGKKSCESCGSWKFQKFQCIRYFLGFTTKQKSKKSCAESA